MKTRVAAVAALVVSAGLALSGCGQDTTAPDGGSSETTPTTTDTAPGTPGDDGAAESGTDADLLAAHGLSGLDAPTLIAQLDTTALAERRPDLMASIRPDELVLADDQGREARLPMPEEEFYVSFAPYVSQTHECHFHSLTTCTGELQDEEIVVRVTDDATGEVLVAETVRTYDNGFYGLWLPRGIEATLEVESDGRSGAVPITTAGADAATCVTTLRLG